MDKGLFHFGSKKIVFLDWWYLEAGYGYRRGSDGPEMMPYGVKLDSFKPKISKTPILVADKPWETDFIGAYISIIKDGDLYKMWYEGFTGYYKEGGDKSSRFCYAESKDGLHWTKPDLGIVEWNGSKENNIIFVPSMHPNKYGFHGSGVFIDSNPECPPNEKFKLVHSSHNARYEGSCYGAVSPDGLHWTPIEKPIARSWADSQNIIHWHPGKEKYIGFFRCWKQNRRSVFYGESEDFRDWPPLVPALRSDPTLPPDHDWYTNGFHFWPGVENAYLLMPTVYRRTQDDLYVEMRGSRDLRNWYKFSNNPIIEPMEQDLPEFYGGQYLGNGIIDRGDGNWSIPLGVPEHHHNTADPNVQYKGKVHLATWREDGFTGLTAAEKGEIWTQPFTFAGNELRLNAWTHPGGNIRLGIMDDFTKRYLPGHALKECDPIRGDCLWGAVTWNGENDMKEFDDVRIRLHFEIVRGTIHAFRFTG